MGWRYAMYVPSAFFKSAIQYSLHWCKAKYATSRCCAPHTCMPFLRYTEGMF